MRVRRWAGLTCAGAMGLYLGVKALWIGAAVLLDETPSGWESGSWVTLNVVTALMASVGVALGLAIAHGWGRRLRAVWVAAPLWVGSGFLVTMLPYSLALALLEAVGRQSDAATTDAATGPETPGWETVMLWVGFTGMAVGLLVGVPLYLHARWPWVFARGHTATRGRHRGPALLATGLLAGLAAVQLGWAAGARWGIRSGAAALETQDRLLVASSGGWCLATAAALVLVVRRRGGGRPVRALLFLGSGSLTAWGGWKLAVTVWDPPGLTRPETLPVAYAVQAAGILAGLAALAVLLRVLPREAG